MMPPGYASFEEHPRALLLRALGVLLLIAGVIVSIWLGIAHADAFDLRLALLIMSPAVILLFAAWLVEHTPSLRGCLTVMALIFAALAAFWAWVGVSMARSPTGEPPTMLQGEPPPEAPANEVAPTNDTGGAQDGPGR